MSLSLSPTLLLFAALAAVVGALATMRQRRTATQTAGDPLPAELAGLQRRQQLLQWGGIAVGAALAAALISSSGELGRIQALAPAVLGIGLILGAVAGEWLPRPHADAPRVAELSPRGATSWLPRASAASCAALFAVAEVVLGACAWVASPDDLGRAGRAFAETCVATGITSTRGPFPGSYYAIPMGGALLIVAAVAGLGLWRIHARRQPGPGTTEWDLTLRRWSARRILRAASVAVLMSLGPVLAVAAAVLASGGQCAEAWQAPVAAVAGVTSGVCLVAGTVTLGLLLGATLPRPLGTARAAA